jgi:HEPN domain-containing protein
MKKGRRKFTLQDGYSSKDLLQYGIDHLACANQLLQKHPRAYDSAGYLAHLGIELIMKAILLFTQGYFTDTHDLLLIYKDLSSLRKKWILPKKHIETMFLVNNFFKLRYPNVKSVTEIGSDDWPKIKSLSQILVKRMAKSLKNEIKKINIPEKGNRILMYQKTS